MSTPKPLPSTFYQAKFVWLLMVATGLSFGFTVTYAASLSFSAKKLGILITSVASPTVAVRVLRILSEVTSLLFTAVIACTLDAIMWTTLCHEKGSRIVDLAEPELWNWDIWIA